jgi:hypothetical protein
MEIRIIFGQNELIILGLIAAVTLFYARMLHTDLMEFARQCLDKELLAMFEQKYDKIVRACLALGAGIAFFFTLLGAAFVHLVL